MQAWVEMGPLTDPSMSSFDKLIHLPKNSSQNSEQKTYRAFSYSIALLSVIAATLGQTCLILMFPNITLLHILQPFKLRFVFTQSKKYNT